MEDIQIVYNQSNNLLDDAKQIIESARQIAVRSVDFTLIQRNWLLGKRISIEELKGEGRADYGKEVIKKLSGELVEVYGKGFSVPNLYHFVDFYKSFNDFQIFYTLCRKSWNLSWSHFRTILQEKDQQAREWYIKEANYDTWSVRTLQRNISSQYYQRTLLSQHKELVEKEMKELTSPLQDKLEFIKNPVVAEFLGYNLPSDYTESQVETSIINNLQKFMMELGKGFAFVGRQERIHTEKEDYYVDLVFYNYLMKCFVLIDLKASKITHQDVGQMDMYVRMYDELKRPEGDNPTLGILLCADTDEDIAKYSVLKGNEQLFATKYKMFLPTEEQLRAEIQSQKNMYYLQHK